MFIINQNLVVKHILLLAVMIAGVLGIQPALAASADFNWARSMASTDLEVGLTFTPQIYYVKWDAAGANNGSSWNDAYIDLQSALTAATSGDEIWVAAGAYKPTYGIDRTISFALKNGVALYGGFAGTETLRSQRIYQTNVTVLSGDIGVLGDSSDNSYHVVVGSDMDNSSILDGFTITGGNANGSSFPSSQAGGGMYNNLGSPTVRNTIFDDNSATFGAGMYNYGDQYIYQGKYFIPVITNVVFSNNSSTEGGGMRNENYSSPVLTDVTFDSNSAIRSGGGMENFGYCDPILTNVTFINNSGGVSGGGIMNWLSNSPSLANVTFSGNTADWGGGISNYLSNPTLTNVTMNDNSATTYGGGISNENDSNPVVHNTILWGNTAPVSAQIYIDASTFTISDSVVEGGYAGGTNIITTDPLLGALGNYGGFTETIPLLGLCKGFSVN